MASGSCLLDTNIVIGLFAADQGILENLPNADAVFIPSIVLGELFYGAQKSGRRKDNEATILAFAAVNTVLACDEGTAYEYGDIKNDLREKGRPLPENDIWIAALARQHNLILITRDHHFDEIEYLSRQTWGFS